MITPDQIIKKARKYIGTPYKWGGNGPDVFDCSGFVNYVFSSFGFNLGRTTYQQIKQGKPIFKKEDLKPGDLVFFLDKDNLPYHVVIYTGNNMMIEAPRAGLNVRERDLYRWDGEARRVLNFDDSTPTPTVPPAVAPNKTFFRVICGSFENKEKARERQEKMKNSGFDTFLLAYDKDGSTFFRVICGSFNSRDIAIERQNILKSKGFETFLLAYTK